MKAIIPFGSLVRSEKPTKLPRSQTEAILMTTQSKFLIKHLRITEFDQAVGYTHKKDNSEILLERATTFYNPSFTIKNEKKDPIIEKLPQIENKKEKIKNYLQNLNLQH
jgi:hypothetical protein